MTNKTDRNSPPRDERKKWDRPQVSRIKAGSAESGSGSLTESSFGIS